MNKRLILLLGLVLIAIATTWATGVLYWKRRIRVAVESVRKDPKDVYAVHLILMAEGRSIPVLLQELQDAHDRGNRKMLGTWSHLLREVSIMGTGRSVSDLPSILAGDNESEIESKIARMFHWWECNRHLYPPWYAFWTGARSPL